MAGSKYTIPGLLLLLLGLFLIILYLSSGNYGESDSLSHYLISRYSFKYPGLFLSHWGKPLFTAISAPFSQLGYNGIKIFNILTGLSAAYCSYLVARKLEIRNAWMVLIVTIFAPVYFIYIYTGLTEPLFSLMLILSVYLFLDQRYLFAVLLISFTPFVRNEGLIFILIYFIALILFKKYKLIPFLAFGTVVYSIIGYFYYKDIFWLINKLPYNPESTIYGSGDFWVYFNRTEIIFGYPLAVLSLLGIIFLFWQIYKQKKLSLRSSIFFELYFLFGMSLTFFIVHSFLWWKGMMAVYAQERFMACIIPMVAIIGLSGYNWLEEQILGIVNRKYLQRIIVLTVLGLIIYKPFTLYQVPFKLDNEQLVIKEATDWLKQSTYADDFLFYFAPMVPHFMGIDPFNAERARKNLYTIEKPHERIADGAIIIWDGHYGAERGYTLDKLISNEYLTLIVSFIPDEPFVVVGDEEYGVYIFKKGSGL